MPTDEAALAQLRQANAHYAAEYERRLAAEIVAMLPADRDEARRVLAIIDHILSLETAAAELMPASIRNSPAASAFGLSQASQARDSHPRAGVG
jgi:hypothetical protein